MKKYKLDVVEHSFDDVPGHLDGFASNDISEMYEKEGESFNIYKSYMCEVEVSIRIIEVSSGQVIDSIRYPS